MDGRQSYDVVSVLKCLAPGPKEDVLPIAHQIRRSEYHDSVALMEVARELGRLAGVLDVAVVMATEANLALLKHAGLLVPEMEEATANDLIVAVQADSDAIAEQALAMAGERLVFR